METRDKKKIFADNFEKRIVAVKWACPTLILHFTDY